MGGMFKKPKQPKLPPPPPPPPTVDDAMMSQNAMDTARRRKGSAATILTGPSGINSSPVGTSSLLGA